MIYTVCAIIVINYINSMYFGILSSEKQDFWHDMYFAKGLFNFVFATCLLLLLRLCV